MGQSRVRLVHGPRRPSSLHRPVHGAVVTSSAAPDVAPVGQEGSVTAGRLGRPQVVRGHQETWSGFLSHGPTGASHGDVASVVQCRPRASGRPMRPSPSTEAGWCTLESTRRRAALQCRVHPWAHLSASGRRCRQFRPCRGLLLADGQGHGVALVHFEDWCGSAIGKRGDPCMSGSSTSLVASWR